MATQSVMSTTSPGANHPASFPALFLRISFDLHTTGIFPNRRLSACEDLILYFNSL